MIKKPDYQMRAIEILHHLDKMSKTGVEREIYLKAQLSLAYHRGSIDATANASLEDGNE